MTSTITNEAVNTTTQTSGGGNTQGIKNAQSSQTLVGKQTNVTVGVATKKVLVIDDSRLIRAALTRHLRQSYAVREAEDGEAAWQALLLDPSIQVVISDLEMPGMAGLELLRKMRASKIKRIQMMPVIINSGAEDDERKSVALQMGANEFITKDASGTELLARVESMFKLAQTQRDLENSREVIARTTTFDPNVQMATPHLLDVHLGMMWAYIKRHGGDISLICLRIDKHRLGVNAEHAPFIRDIESRVGEMLARTVRKEDCVARTAEMEFTIAAAGIDGGGARAFANRLRASVAALQIEQAGRRIELVASAGICNMLYDKVELVQELRLIAHERADDAQALGGDQVLGGEVTRKAGRVGVDAGQAVVGLDLARSNIASDAVNQKNEAVINQAEAKMPNVNLALEWIAAGREADVVPHLEDLMRQIWPLIKLIDQQQRENGAISVQ